jgi:ABC-2 type transport system permease protein
LFFLELIGFTFLGCTLLSSLGVLVSLRSATARQAYQRLSVVLLIVCVLPTIVLQFIPQQIKTTLFATLEGLDFYKALGMISLALVMIDTALLVAAFKRFKRSQLVLA